MMLVIFFRYDSLPLYSEYQKSNAKLGHSIIEKCRGYKQKTLSNICSWENQFQHYNRMNMYACIINILVPHEV